MPQFDYTAYGELLRFGAAEARAISWGTDTTKKAAQLVHHAALGHNEPLLQLADLLHEHDHPAAGIVQRAAEGQGIEGDGYARDTLALNHAVNHGPRENYKPINFAVMPDGGHGTLRVEYLHLPNSHHFFHVRASSFDPEGNRVERSLLVPTTPEEADEYGQRLQGIEGDRIQQEEGQAISKAAHGKPPQEAYYHDGLREAGLGHLVPAGAAEEVARHSKSVAEALRFAAGEPEKPTPTNAELMLKNLASWDLAGDAGGTDHTARAVTADALQEEGREHEAHLLRTRAPLKLKDGKLHPDYPAHDLGGYPLYYSPDRTGEVLCAGCTNKNAHRWADDQVNTEGVGFNAHHPNSIRGDVHHEGPPLQCDGCGEEIESAYGDPDDLIQLQ